jgi:hemolysin activation/secretion protein
MPIFKSNQERLPLETRRHRVRMLIRASISLALAAVIALLSCLSASPVLAQAQITLPRPTPRIDPTGRSNEPPMLFEELPQAPPAGAILPPFTIPEPSEAELVPGIRVFVRKIQITGSTVFTSEQFSPLIAPYLDKEVTSEDLEALRVALTRLYVNRGYVNSGAILPDQTVADGVISYQIIEGKLSDTQIHGNRWLRAQYYRDRVALSARPPLNVDTLQERLQLLLEDPRIERLNAELKPGATPADATLDVRVEERSPFQVTFDFDNYQAPSVGAQRGVVTVEDLSLTGNADPLSLSYGRSRGLDPLLELSYLIPITAHDTSLGFQYRRNDITVVEAPFEPLDIRSSSETYTLSLRQPIYRTPSTLIALELLGERSGLQTSVSGIPFSLEDGAVGGRSAVTAVRFAQELVYRTRSEVIAARSRFSVGLDALGSTVHNDDKPDSRFFSWLGQFQYVRQLGIFERLGIPETQLIFRSDLQLTNQPLLTLEQIALGGRYTVRGYPQNALVRDNAFITSVEARIPIIRNRPWADYVELAPFFDYGRGWNSGRDSQATFNLSGIGVGLRWGLAVNSRIHLRPQFEIYWGQPLRKIETSATKLQGNGLYFQFLLSAF